MDRGLDIVYGFIDDMDLRAALFIPPSCLCVFSRRPLDCTAIKWRLDAPLENPCPGGYRFCCFRNAFDRVKEEQRQTRYGAGFLSSRAHSNMELPEHDLSRRAFVGLAAGAASLTTSVADAATPHASAGAIATSLNINGHVHDLQLEPRVTLLDLLRERLHLTGSKKGCDHGQCGACTVLVDGVRVLSCLTLAVTQDRKRIRHHRRASRRRRPSSHAGSVHPS